MGTRAPAIVAVASICAVALGGAVAAVNGRGADDEFLLRQENPTKLSAPAVEKLMLGSPDPAPPHTSGADRAECTPLGNRDLRNPWVCTVEYPSGSVARYSVTINGDGSYLAHYARGTATARGCCLTVPGADG